ncbi:17756_t:CDS:10 [Funneliformis geosporum]|uniref:550_t:CDS:1 n=1 Tax=Funneliformis geosporum TaxID=1117311 RepID=A0A9W4SUC6_9GLOM|nr:550_t:CDS:10 [Funneliformis geosporum]CAI2181841.1 17756_t:CDS:10 [Funneliformis geosporum]
MPSSDESNSPEKVNSSDKSHQIDNPYQIAINLDGTFVVTFDTVNLNVKILKNTDYRPSIIESKDIGTSTQNSQDKLNEVIAHFKINKDLDIVNSLDKDYKESPTASNENNKVSEDGSQLWILDISNIQQDNNEKVIFVAISHINEEENSKKKDEGKRSINYMENHVKMVIFASSNTVVPVNETENYGTAIYRIPKFIEDFDPEGSANNDAVLQRFLILNCEGIYNFRYNKNRKNNKFILDESFEYPKSIAFELENTKLKSERMEVLFTSICDKYLLVEQYKNDMQALEVYNLVEMELEITSNRVETEHVQLKEYHKNHFLISGQKLQFCFTKGHYSVSLYLMENGLEILEKKFNDLIDRIYSMEFIDNDKKLLIIGRCIKAKHLKVIVWDMYNTGESIPIDEFSDSFTEEGIDNWLAKTSGNVLRVDDKGNVTSILKKLDVKYQKYLKEKSEKVEYASIDLKKEPSKEHILYPYENKEIESIVYDKEPWMLKGYTTTSFFLFHNEYETLQLLVGSSTVQVWHQIHKCKGQTLPNKGVPFLEYIWTNGIPVDQEYFDKDNKKVLKIEKIKVGKKRFYMEVSWYETEDGKEIFKKKTIQWQGNDEQINAIRYACKALEHLNKRVRCLTNYCKKYNYEEMVKYIKHIIWRFIRHRPNEYKMLDVRHNVMKNLILGDCNDLIYYILFGEKNDGINGNRKVNPIPRNKLWKKRSFVKDDDLDQFDPKNIKRVINPLDMKDRDLKNDLELAIHHCKEREFKDTVIVAYLLEYYSTNAIKSVGWMCTVSKALPLLYKYDYDEYAKRLFRKRCFADQNYFSAHEHFDIIPENYLNEANDDNKFVAFRPRDRLRSDKVTFLYNWPQTRNFFNYCKEKMSKGYKFFNVFHHNPPIALRVVPLPDYTRPTTYKNLRDNNNYDFWKNICTLIWILFIPRWYKFSSEDTQSLSPFARVIRHERNDSMYDNPATEAIINYRWQQARRFFLSLFFRYILYSLSFMIVSWAYLDHKNINAGAVKTLFVLIILFYYLALYTFVNEMIQLWHRGIKKYFSVLFNIFDLMSILIPVTVMSLIVIDFRLFDGGFVNVEVDRNKVVGIATSIFVIWIELVLYLRSISCKFCLLKNPNIIPNKESTFSGNFTDPGTNEITNISLKADYNPDNSDDNPFKQFHTSLIAAFFWSSGDFVQLDSFDFWAVQALTEQKGRQALLRFRAKQIADFEALHHPHFWPHEADPKCVYYVGRSKNFEEWRNSIDDKEKIYDEEIDYNVGYADKSNSPNDGVFISPIGPIAITDP